MNSPRKSILKSKGYEIPLSIDNYRLKLDSNENVIGPSPKIMEALKNISEEDIKFYPAYGEILEKLASYNNAPTGMILPANGADEAINYVFDTFIEQQDTVLTVIPSFIMPKIYSGTLGCMYKEVPYIEKWAFPVDELVQNIDEKTKLIIITTPNNPTGEMISRENLVKILKASEGRYVLIDETYISYAGTSFIDLINEFPNIIVVRSMSKDFALAGLRFGYLIASENNIDYIKRVIKPYSINNVAVKCACAALDDLEHLNYVVSQVKESRGILAEGLAPLAKTVYKSDANFILADFGEKADFIYKKLLKSGIKVKNFEKTPHLENCLRITLPDVKNAKYILEQLKPRDLIIFDMDGVLADTSNSYRTAIREVYKEFTGKFLTPEQVQQAKNQGGLNNDWDLTHYLLEQAGINVTFSDIVAKFQELYWGSNGNGFILNENLLISPHKLAELAQKYDLAIFTGRPKQEAEFFLKNKNIDKYFYPVITMDDPPKGMGKPHPWGVYEILKITCPINTYYLGDTVDDMFAARQAGVKGIGVLPPQDKSGELRRALTAHGADEILEHTEDLPQLMRKYDLNSSNIK
ncbi:MAG TPA: histidinol-phosphate transaminase [Candidatus Gastranaerophilales bacterium]|nr:histidinol-phosphate transaminase [Candidatus Gastranaerophilales bacterium]